MSIRSFGAGAIMILSPLSGAEFETPPPSALFTDTPTTIAAEIHHAAESDQKNSEPQAEVHFSTEVGPSSSELPLSNRTLLLGIGALSVWAVGNAIRERRQGPGSDDH